MMCTGFTPTYADPNVWTHDAGSCCECVVVCVNDALMVLKDPSAFCKDPQSNPWNHNSKILKNPNIIWVVISSVIRMEHCAQICVKHLIDAHKELFREQPKEVHAPLDKNNKPELDDNPLLESDGIKPFQTFTGAAQWLITLSQFDMTN